MPAPMNWYGSTTSRSGRRLRTRPATVLSYLDLLLDKREDEARKALGRITFSAGSGRTRRTRAMFETYYGFTQTPFTRAVAPAALFPSEQHQELPARLRYLVQSRGFGLVTGEVGLGKSTAVQALASTLDGSRHPVLHVSQSGLTPRNLYRDIGLQLGLDPGLHTAAARRQVTPALWERPRRPRPPVPHRHRRGPPPLTGHGGGDQVPHQLQHGLRLAHGPVPGRPARTPGKAPPEGLRGHQPEGDPSLAPHRPARA